MRRLLLTSFCLTLTPLLAGCVQMQEYARQQELARQQQIEMQRQADINHCKGFGYPNPSREFSDCMMTLYQERREDERRAMELDYHDQQERDRRYYGDRDRRDYDRPRRERLGSPFSNTQPGFTPPAAQPAPQKAAPAEPEGCIPYIPGSGKPRGETNCRSLGSKLR